MQHHGLEGVRPPLCQRLAQLPQGGQTVAHSQPATNGQQRQGVQQGHQHPFQNCPQNLVTRVGLLTHKNLHIALVAMGAKDPPGCFVFELNGGKAAQFG